MSFKKVRDKVRRWFFKDYYLYFFNMKKTLLKNELLFSPNRLTIKPLDNLIRGNSPYYHFEKREKISEFQHYGHDFILKRYSGLKKNYDTGLTAEHGCFFHNECLMLKNYRSVKYALTMSKRREVILREIGIRSFSIGPYIHYSKLQINNKEVKRKKKELGKTLTYFPQHSHEKSDFKFDHDRMVHFLSEEKNKKNIDSIIICYYWHDLVNGNDLKSKYSGIDHIPACAGHRSNPFFLDNLRLIFELSDYTLSNDIGTYSGYSIFLNKPHVIFQDDIGEFDPNEKETFKTLFKSKDSNSITEHQRKFCEEYWGLNQTCSQKELNTILKSEA